MSLRINLEQVPIKITGENNTKLSEIMEHPLLQGIERNKKMFVNKIIEATPPDDLVSLYRKALGFDAANYDK